MTKKSAHEGERIKLSEWEEIIAEFNEIKRTKESVKVSLYFGTSQHLLQYPTSSKESKLLEQSLRGVEEGSKIGILRTDSSLKIRIIDCDEGVNKNESGSKR